MAQRVRQIGAEETRALRCAILRPGQPAEAAIYPGDDDPGSIHLGAFRSDQLVGIASFYLEPWPGAPDEPAGRLRGMATHESVRGAGHGRALFEAGWCWAEQAELARIWCNARSRAAGFYQRMGFRRHGAEFEIAGIGPHFVMSYPLR